MLCRLTKIAFAAVVFAAVPAPVAWAADTNTYAVLHASEPPIPEGQGRIYLYRESSVFGVIIQPTIKIDGQPTGGESHSGEYFYIDRAAGTYVISTSTEKKEQVSVTVVAGQVVYVKTSVSMGLFVGHVSPEVVPAAVAEREIKDCDYTPPKASPATVSAPVAPATTPVAPATTPGAPASTTAPAAPATPPATDNPAPADNASTTKT